MQPPPRQVQSLDYHTPLPAKSKKRTVILVVSLVLGALLLSVAGMAFFSASPRAMTNTPSSGTAKITGPAQPTIVGIAPGLLATSDAPTQAAAAAATNVLDNLLAGKLDNDPDLAQPARKVKGFQTWSITSISNIQAQPPACTFTGTLNAPGNTAAFSIHMVKQQNGKWGVAVFSGPNPN